MTQTVEDLILILRNVTGRVDSSDPLFTDEIMTNYLINFSKLQSTQDIRIFKNYTWYEFSFGPTDPNPYPVSLQDLVLVNGAIGASTIQPPAYVQLTVPSSSEVDVTNVAMVGVVDGVNQIFTLTANIEVVPGTFVVTGTNPPQTLVDDGLGVFAGDGSGTINYQTGLVSIVFTTAPVVASTVTASYTYFDNTQVVATGSNSFELWWFQDPQQFFARWPDNIVYTPQRPTAVLYYNNELLFRGPPERQYNIKIAAYQVELLFNPNGTMNNEYLYRYMCYGAALDIFSDYGEMDKYRDIFTVYQRYRAFVYGRTNCQYQNQRPSPEF